MKTETKFSSDILQPILLEEWPLLQELLKVDWPRYACYYYWIQNSTKWKKLNPELAIQIYCPQGKYQDDATFVGITSYGISSVIVCTKDKCGKQLRDAIIQTSRINWSMKIVFIGVHEYIQPILFSALATLRTSQGIEIAHEIPGCFRIKSADECASVEIKVPDGCYLKVLDSSCLSIIHSAWPHADPEHLEDSMKLLLFPIILNKSIGLFLKEGDILVSWALHNEWHGLGAVQTLESHKRKGYAKVVVNALAKQLGKQGISPILSVIQDNIVSENMFASLNWKRTIPNRWVYMKEHPSKVN